MTEVGVVLDPDEKARFAEYLSDRYGENLQINPSETQMIIGYNGANLVFVAGYHNYRKTNSGAPIEVEFSLAVIDKSKITRTCVKEVCRYPFLTLGVRRMTAFISASNEKSMGLAENHGWVKEGLKRRAAPDGGDIVIWGLLKEECRYLRKI